MVKFQYINNVRDLITLEEFEENLLGLICHWLEKEKKEKRKKKKKKVARFN
jgi:hypothetical protein